MQKTYTEFKAAAVSTIMEPERENNTAATSTVYMLEQEVLIYEQKLVNLFSSSNEARNSSDPCVLMSLSEDLEVAGDSFVYAARKLIDARGTAGYPYAKEELKLNNLDLFRNQFSVMRLLQNRHINFADINVHKSALDESRQNSSTLIDHAYYASHSENGIFTVEQYLLKTISWPR